MRHAHSFAAPPIHAPALVTALAGALLVGLMPSAADAQWRRTRPRDRDEVEVVVRERRDGWYGGGRHLSLLVGVLNSGFPGNEQLPMAALRADWRLSRWVRSEVDVTYATGELELGAPVGDIDTGLFTATVGVQGELPTPFVRPYAGAAAGLFGRFDEKGQPLAQRFVRTTMAFPVGVRVPLSWRLALRAEARFRFDADPGGATTQDVEQTVGLSFSF